MIITKSYIQHLINWIKEVKTDDEKAKGEFINDLTAQLKDLI